MDKLVVGFGILILVLSFVMAVATPQNQPSNIGSDEWSSNLTQAILGRIAFDVGTAIGLLGLAVIVIGWRMKHD